MLENSDIFKSQNSYICLRYYTYLFKSNFVFNYLVSRIWKLQFSCLRHRSPANVKDKGVCMLVMKQYTSNLPGFVGTNGKGCTYSANDTTDVLKPTT